MNVSSIDEAIGLATYATDHLGIHGVLKMRPGDFRVEEVGRIPALQDRGRFTAIRVTLTDWETNRFIERFAKACGISRNRIWFSGTKDKRAVTTQTMVVDAPRKKVESVEMTDVDVEILGRTHQKARMGDHSGNRFTITVRGCADSEHGAIDGKEAMSRVHMIRSSMEGSFGEGVFPNWVGPQRFGTIRPVTPIVGRKVLEGEFQGAVSSYLGMPGIYDAPPIETFRTAWREREDVEECLAIVPDSLGFERRMLESLKRNPDDWVRSFTTLPRNLQLMTVHALQSVAFNHLLAARIAAGLPIASPVEGDLVAPLMADGKADVSKSALVDGSNISRVRRNCALGRLIITGPLPGADMLTSEGEPGEMERRVIEELGLSGFDWQVPSIPRLSSNGTRRPLTSRFREFGVEETPELDASSLSERWSSGPREGEIWDREGACLRMRFTLPPGTYATVLLREFMKAPSSQI